MPKALAKTSGGLIAVEEIPDILLQERILGYLKMKCSHALKLDDLATEVFRYAKFTYRGTNRDAMIKRIWAITDQLIEQGSLILHETKSITKVKLNLNKSE